MYGYEVGRASSNNRLNYSNAFAFLKFMTYTMLLDFSSKFCLEEISNEALTSASANFCKSIFNL
jgi:hypothetical protein